MRSGVDRNVVMRRMIIKEILQAKIFFRDSHTSLQCCYLITLSVAKITDRTTCVNKTLLAE
jgi:hypothetical protein